jgi:PTH1 family peptidyl-tRNA hydrolase
VKYLIVGLGNPGLEYKNTRHNIGYTVLDAFAESAGIAFFDKRYAYRAETSIKGRSLILIKPTTYMNLSGNAVRYYMNQEKIPVENVFVIVDDLALPFGTIRIKPKGSSGGHNGLQNIQDTIGTSEYARLRFGIGNEFSRGGQIDFVLGEWTKEESENLKSRVEIAVNAIKDFPLIGIERTMNTYNNK